MAYAIAAAVVAGIGVAIWLYFAGRSAGANSQRVGDLAKAAAIKDKQIEEANKPRDPQSVVDALRKGEF